MDKVCFVILALIALTACGFAAELMLSACGFWYKISKTMKKVCFVITVLLLLSACDFGSKWMLNGKSQKTAEDTNICKKYTGVIARERYISPTHNCPSQKCVLFEDGETRVFVDPSIDLVLAEPGDTLVFQLDHSKVEIKRH